MCQGDMIKRDCCLVTFLSGHTLVQQHSYETKIGTRHKKTRHNIYCVGHTVAFFKPVVDFFLQVKNKWQVKYQALTSKNYRR